ncbi:MAG: TlpA disulfide reductase family protein [Anaerovoracaceae bacterium]
MKKKVLVVTVVLVLSLIMVACGQNDGTENSSGESQTSGKSVGQFTAKTIEDETVSDEIFKEKKLTVLKLWSVDCSPCLYEMPEVLKLNKNLPDDAQLVTVVTDKTAPKSEIYKLTGSSKKDYKIIYLNDEIWNNFMNNYTMTPTTLFINQKGEIVGDHIGVPDSKDISGEYIKMAKGYIK